MRPPDRWLRTATMLLTRIGRSIALLFFNRLRVRVRKSCAQSISSFIIDGLARPLLMPNGRGATWETNAGAAILAANSIWSISYPSNPRVEMNEGWH